MTDVGNFHLAVERLTPQFWRVTFEHGPITAETVAELSRTGVVPGGGPMARLATLASHGLGSESELERRLGELVTLATGPADPSPRPTAGAAGMPG